MIVASSHIKSTKLIHSSFTKKFSECVQPMDRNTCLDEIRLQNNDICNQKLDSKDTRNKKVKKNKTKLTWSSKRSISTPISSPSFLAFLAFQNRCSRVTTIRAQRPGLNSESRENQWFCDNHDAKNTYIFIGSKSWRIRRDRRF